MTLNTESPARVAESDGIVSMILFAILTSVLKKLSQAVIISCSVGSAAIAVVAPHAVQKKMQRLGSKRRMTVIPRVRIISLVTIRPLGFIGQCWNDVFGIAPSTG